MLPNINITLYGSKVIEKEILTQEVFLPLKCDPQGLEPTTCWVRFQNQSGPFAVRNPSTIYITWYRTVLGNELVSKLLQAVRILLMLGLNKSVMLILEDDSL